MKAHMNVFVIFVYFTCTAALILTVVFKDEKPFHSETKLLSIVFHAQVAMTLRRAFCRHMNYYNFQTSTSVSLETISAVKRATNSAYTLAPAQLWLACSFTKQCTPSTQHITTYQPRIPQKSLVVAFSVFKSRLRFVNTTINSIIDTIDYVNGIGNGRKLCYTPGCAQSINNAF